MKEGRSQHATGGAGNVQNKVKLVVPGPLLQEECTVCEGRRQDALSTVYRHCGLGHHPVAQDGQPHGTDEMRPYVARLASTAGRGGECV